MSLQEQIRTDLKESMKAKTEARTSAIRIILGEFQRQPKKELADPEVVAIIRKLIKSETELLAASNKKPDDSNYIAILDAYLPQQATEEEIKKWVADNIDLSSFNNKMQAMKPIMNNFAGRTDGNTVKNILQDL
ncbi:MAG: GatB/YqeY domain-containing protein [Thermodesulfobacteriota bacterium]